MSICICMRMCLLVNIQLEEKTCTNLFCLVPLNWWGKKTQEAQGWYTMVCVACWDSHSQTLVFNYMTMNSLSLWNSHFPSLKHPKCRY